MGCDDSVTVDPLPPNFKSCSSMTVLHVNVVRKRHPDRFRRPSDTHIPESQFPPNGYRGISAEGLTCVFMRRNIATAVPPPSHRRRIVSEQRLLS